MVLAAGAGVVLAPKLNPAKGFGGAAVVGGAEALAGASAEGADVDEEAALIVETVDSVSLVANGEELDEALDPKPKEEVLCAGAAEPPEAEPNGEAVVVDGGNGLPELPDVEGAELAGGLPNEKPANGDDAAGAAGLIAVEGA